MDSYTDNSLDKTEAIDVSLVDTKNNYGNNKQIVRVNNKTQSRHFFEKQAAKDFFTKGL